MSEFCFCTPRIIMHRCCASMTTPTPSALIESLIALAICCVSLSWICSRLTLT